MLASCCPVEQQILSFQNFFYLQHLLTLTFVSVGYPVRPICQVIGPYNCVIWKQMQELSLGRSCLLGLQTYERKEEGSRKGWAEGKDCSGVLTKSWRIQQGALKWIFTIRVVLHQDETGCLYLLTAQALDIVTLGEGAFGIWGKLCRRLSDDHSPGMSLSLPHIV